MIDAKMVAGEEFVVDFEISVNGIPDSIFGYAAKIDLRENDKSKKLIASWDDSSPAIIRDDVNGLLTLSLPASVTNTFAFESARMDLLLLNAPKGRRSAVLNIELDRGITR